MVQTVNIRKWTAEDKGRLLRWRNTPFIYNRGFTGSPATQDQHNIWFEKMTEDLFCDLYIIEENDTSCGMVSFEIKGGAKKPERVISIYLTKQFSGKGIGPQAIKLACERVPESPPIVAYFRDGNIYSMKAFKKAGFKKSGANRMVYKI